LNTGVLLSAFRFPNNVKPLKEISMKSSLKIKRISFVLSALLILMAANTVFSQQADITKKLKGLDQTIEKILKDWNVPGCGIGIVVKDKLVYSKGYGYRNIENKMPVTTNTLFQIASNTKLFTATAVGFLVEDGKLEWDKPIKNYVPQIQFYNSELNANVTIKDMLSHRTGISRHDLMWYNSDFTRQELFDRIKYLEPSIPLRQGYLYNNLMYAAAGQIIEYLSGQSWEEFVKNRIFIPLNMTSSIFVVEDMQKQPDFLTPYYEKRDTNILLAYPFYTKQKGVGPCGAIISNINDLSNWLICQMNGGKFKSNRVIPENIIRETMQPAMPTASVPDRYFENLNSIYGMGRTTSSYKGHYLTQHGGAIGGIYSNISFMPADSIGIIVFTNRISQLPYIITNTIYDRILGLPETQWSERGLKDFVKSKETAKESRKKPETDRVPGTKPSHKMGDYAGTYEDPGYGTIKISLNKDTLGFSFNSIELPLYHYHYDRFITTDDEINGKWSLLFLTDAQGAISQLKISLDEKEAVFTKKGDSRLSDPQFLRKLEGQYELNGGITRIVLSNNELVVMTSPPQHLVPYKDNMFRVKEFSDHIVEFIFDEKGETSGVKVTAEGMSFFLTKKK
jgi:CubicO group peptidase (beta-lactamase class C family)